MPEQIENRNSCGNEIEYGTRHKTRYERTRYAFDEAEREDLKNGRFTGND